jgi:hypothetical protein
MGRGSERKKESPQNTYSNRDSAERSKIELVLHSLGKAQCRTYCLQDNKITLWN